MDVHGVPTRCRKRISFKYYRPLETHIQGPSFSRGRGDDIGLERTGAEEDRAVGTRLW